MRTLTAALLLAMAASLGATQARDGNDDGDKIGKLSAPAVLQKALRGVAKRKVAEIAQKSEIAFGRRKTEADFSGILKQDFAGVKGGEIEVYAKGAKVLAKVGDVYDPPEKIDGPEAGQALSFKNPALIIAQLTRILRMAQFAADEDVEGIPCALVVIVADTRTVVENLKDLNDRLSTMFGRRDPDNPGRGGFMRMLGADMFDRKESSATYAVWISRKDLSIRKLEYVLSPVVKPNSLPTRVQNFKVATRITTTFSKWDGDVKFDIPEIVKRKFRVR